MGFNGLEGLAGFAGLNGLAGFPGFEISHASNALADVANGIEDAKATKLSFVLIRIL
jgi:hypothetical protein